MCSIRDLRTRLSERIFSADIRQIIGDLQVNHDTKELLNLIFDDDAAVAYRALWICDHLPDEDIDFLPEPVTVKLIDAVIACRHDGVRRLMMNLIYRQPVCRSRLVELLDFCLERSLSTVEPSGVRAICLKSAYKLTAEIPELQTELYNILDIMNESDLSPSLSCTRRNILKLIACNNRGNRK